MPARCCIPLIGVCLMAVGLGCETTDKQPAEENTVTEMTHAPVPPPEPRDGVIPVNRPAPDFEALDQTGKRVVLSELLERHDVVLIFYPADFTPGCTKQLCAVRDDWSTFQSRGAVVLGVNPASVERHAEFADAHGFTFPVVHDEGARIAAGYGAQGKNPDNPQRTVYVIRRDGKVALAERGMVPHDKIFAALDRP